MGLNSTAILVSPRPSLRRDLNRDFERLLALICGSVADFALYDTSKIAVSISRSRRNGRAGTLAYVVPLRYVGGAKERKGRRWGVPGVYFYESFQVERDQPRALYIMTFLVPKFFSLKPEDRLETIVHELYHLHPEMRGDLRRFAAPHIHHGPTPAAYNRKVKSLCAEALTMLPTLKQHPLLCMGESEIGDFRSKRFNIPRHVFKPKIPSLFLAAVFVLGAVASGLLHASQVPVVTINEGAMRVAPEGSAGVEKTFKRGDRFDAHKLSEDRQWVWVSNGSLRGWIHRSSIQSRNLDRGLGLRGAFVDPYVPNKLGESKTSVRENNDDDYREKEKKLKAQSKPGSGVSAENALTEKELLTEPDAASGSDSDSDFESEPDAESGSVSESDALAALSEVEPHDDASAVSQDVPVIEGTELDLRGDLEENPSADQLKDLKLSPEEKAHLEEGERVTKSQIRAQSRLSPIKKNEFLFRGAEATAALDNSEVVTWEESFDPDRDRAEVIVEGKLFESPDENAKRYGILQVGDPVLPLAHTEDGKWERVRFEETGEEGWFPASSLKISQTKKVQKPALQNTFEMHGGWGSRSHSFGFGAGYHYAFGFDERFRHWSLGGDFTYWLGSGQVSETGASYSAKYFAIDFLARYLIPSTSSGFMALIEAGLGYQQALVTTGNLGSESGFTGGSSFVINPLLGVGAKYRISENFDVFAIARIRLSSSTMVHSAVGVGVNF